MRIISALVTLRIILALFIIQGAEASELQETNETKTNSKTQSNLIIKDGILLSRTDWMISENQEDFEGVIKEKTEEDLKREKILERFSEKRKLANFPKGKFIINASAYTAAADECGKSDGITASGLLVKENETLACPPQFPFGTKIQIEGMGTYVCQDRGGAIKGNHVDIYVETKTQAFAFGRRNLLAEVVEL